jgi:uncharacterized membrane protein
VEFNPLPFLRFRRNLTEYSVKGRVLLAVLFLLSGSFHFLAPHLYLRIMPPYLPAPLALVDVSGAIEMLGGAGLLIPTSRRVAAWSLVVLLFAVLPANIYMATAHLAAPGVMGHSWAQWLRIPLQLPLIYWTWLYTRTP